MKISFRGLESGDEKKLPQFLNVLVLRNFHRDVFASFRCSFKVGEVLITACARLKIFRILEMTRV